MKRMLFKCSSFLLVLFAVMPLLVEVAIAQDSYYCEGTFRTGYPCSNAVDGEWTTWTAPESYGGSVNIIENHNIPRGITGANWIFKAIRNNSCIEVKAYYWDYQVNDWVLFFEAPQNLDYVTYNVEVPANGLLNSPMKIKMYLKNASSPCLLQSAEYYDGEVQWLNSSTWCDDFESYSSSSGWSANWHGSGNTPGISVVSTYSSSLSNSLRMYGSIGGCWGAVATHPIQMNLPMEISFSVRNGNENLYGCHPYRGVLGLRTGGPDWWDCPCPQFVVFLENGGVRIPSESGVQDFPGFPLGLWHHVRCQLTNPSDGFLHAKIWINEEYLGESTWPFESWMTGSAYVDISGQEGTVWFDDVCVTHLEGEEPPNGQGANLSIAVRSYEPSNPTAFEYTKVNFTIYNNGDRLWSGRSLLLGIVGYDIEDMGVDGHMLWLNPFINQQSRFIDYVNLGFIQDIPAGGNIWLSAEVRFTISDFIDEVCVNLEPTVEGEELDDIDDGYPEWCNALNVTANESYLALNCLGTILTGLTNVNIDEQTLEAMKTGQKVVALGASGIPQPGQYIEDWQAGHRNESIRSLLDEVRWYLSFLSAQYSIMGISNPFLSYINVIFSELSLRGCGALITHILLEILSWDLAMTLEHSGFPGLVLWGVRSPADLLIRCNGELIRIGDAGPSPANLERLSGFSIEGSKILLDYESSEACTLGFEGTDTGVADFIYYEFSMTGAGILYYSEIPLTATSIGFLKKALESDTYPSLALDSNGDGTIDDTFLPIYLDSFLFVSMLHGTVKCQGAPQIGIPVAIYDNGMLLTSTVTNENGQYQFLKVPNGIHLVTLVTPIGYTVAAETEEMNTVGLPLRVDFELTKTVITPQQRTRGYWAFQAYKAFIDHPIDYTIADFSRFTGLIKQHFNENSLNPIDFYTVPQPASPNDSLKVLKTLLLMESTGGTEHFQNRYAKSELLSMMLNVVSGKISQTHPISEDGRTVSQAITYCDYLINGIPADMETIIQTSADSLWKYRRAIDVASKVNSGVLVSAGKIPEEILDIAYRQNLEEILPSEYSLSQNYPNPFNSATTIEFTLAKPTDVSLEVFNITGQKIKTLNEGMLEAGNHSVIWDCTDSHGKPVASGIYLYRLKAGEFVETKKMILLK